MKHAPILFLSTALVALPAAGQVKITPAPQRIAVEINGKPFTDFYVGGETVTKPYLWPLRAATGMYITRMWPMEKVAEEEKEKKDHQHQRGLWFAHDKVNGVDFWNNEADYPTPPRRGNIALKKLEDVKNGSAQGSIAAVFEWAERGSTAPFLTESRVMTFYADKEQRVFDLDITLSALQKVTFGDGKDGLLGVRLRPVLQEDKGTGRLTNAEGLETMKALWGKPSPWCDYSGAIGDEKVGIAILDHPENPRHPVRWHARDYGLFAANPFGLSAFTNDKSQDGSVTLEPGKSLRYRYRLIIHPGDVKSANIAAAYAKYTGKK